MLMRGVGIFMPGRHLYATHLFFRCLPLSDSKKFTLLLHVAHALYRPRQCSSLMLFILWAGSAVVAASGLRPCTGAHGLNAWFVVSPCAAECPFVVIDGRFPCWKSPARIPINAPSGSARCASGSCLAAALFGRLRTSKLAELLEARAWLSVVASVALEQARCERVCPESNSSGGDFAPCIRPSFCKR